MPKLEVLVGMIASGKSTYCEKRAREGAIIINDDAIITALHGGSYEYHRELKPGYKTVQADIARTFLLMGRDVVIDSTNLVVKTRRKWIELALELDAEPIAIVFKYAGPTEHARRRFQSDNRGLSLREWDNIARTHDMELEAISSREPFAKILHQ